MIPLARKIVGLGLDAIEVVQSVYVAALLRLQGGRLSRKARILGVPFLRVHGELIIHDGVVIRSGKRYASSSLAGMSTIDVRAGGRLEICQGAGISNAVVVCSNSIRIEAGAMIGVDARIYDTDFHSVEAKDRFQEGAPGGRRTNVKSGEVVIGRSAWIGAGSWVLKGVRIGAGAVIGAGSIVTKSVGDYELWAGNPARFIRNLPVPNRVEGEP